MKQFTAMLVAILLLPGLYLGAQGLKVKPGTCLKVESGTTLDMTGGNLTLESDDTGDASLIDLGSVTYSGGGEARVERYLTQSQWHLISPPVSDAQSGMFEDAYLQYFTELTSAYTDITSLTYALEPMHGYSLWMTDSKAVTATFTGTTNTGSQQYLITADGARHNLVGNPYPSAIDWEEVTIPADLMNYFYVWNPDKGTSGDFEYYQQGGSELNSTTQYIASGQGFFVRTPESAPSHQFTLDNNVRTHSTKLFYKNSTNAQELLLKVSGNNVTTQTGLRFTEEATPLIDRLYDVEKMISGNPDIPNIYSFAENEKMAINSLPSIEEHAIIPLGFEAGLNGKYTITASLLENIPDEYPVILEDVDNETYHDLRSNPQYTFNYVAGEEKAFKLHFKDATEIEEQTTGSLQVNCFLKNNLLHVNFVGSEPFSGEANIAVYSITGQLLLTTKATGADTETPFRGSAAMYVVHISYNNQVYSTKVFNN